MNNIIKKLNLPTFDDDTCQELSNYQSIYDRVSIVNDRRVDIRRKKREIINSTFDVLSGFFNFPYDIKLTFNEENASYDTLYFEYDINDDYKKVFYDLYKICFIKYLNDIYLHELSNVNSSMFTLVRLASINNDKNVLENLVNSTYLSLLTQTCPSLCLDIEKPLLITKEQLNLLLLENKARNNSIKNKMLAYDLDEDLSVGEINNVITCFSSDIFYSLNKKEKIYLASLLYNYYSIEGKVYKYDEYKNMIIAKTTNKELLEMIIKDLMKSGNSLMIKRRNQDLLNDFLKILKTIYKNEIKINNINSLDSLKNIEVEKKKS